MSSKVPLLPEEKYWYRESRTSPYAPGDGRLRLARRPPPIVLSHAPSARGRRHVPTPVGHDLHRLVFTNSDGGLIRRSTFNSCWTVARQIAMTAWIWLDAPAQSRTRTVAHTLNVSARRLPQYV